MRTARSRGLRLLSWRSLGVLLVGEGLTRGLSFIAVARVVHRLGAVAFGPVAVALGWLQFGALAVECGFPLLGAREVARDPSRAARLLPRVLATQLAVALALATGAFAVAKNGLVERSLAELLPLYALSLFFLPFLVPWIFQGRGRMAWVALPQVVRQAVFLAATVALVAEPGDAARVAWAEIGAVAAAALAAQILLRREGERLAIEPRGAFAPALMSAALPIGGSQLLWALRMYLPTVMLALWVEAAAIARYDVAHRLIMVTQAALAVYFTNLYPALARAVPGSRQRLRALLRPSTAIAAGGLLVVALAFAVEGRVLLPRLFGADFAHPESADCLAVLAFVLPVLACRGHARLTLLALGEARRELLCSIGGTVALPLLLWWAVPGEGVVGAARAVLLAELLGAALTIGTCRMALRRMGPTGGLETAKRDA